MVLKLCLVGPLGVPGRRLPGVVESVDKCHGSWSLLVPVCTSTALLLALKFFFFFVSVLHIIFSFKKSAVYVFHLKFGDPCFRCLVVLVYCSSMHWGVFTGL